MTGLLFLLASALVCFSFYGWGRLSIRLVRYGDANAADTMAIGLAMVIFVGGVLNLLRLCYGVTLDSLVGAGVLLACYRSKPTWKFHDIRTLIYPGTAGFVIVMITGCAVFMLLPPSAFNYHDDFIKYFTHPLRMLQTGTLFGSPLSAIGYETVGGQALLHGLALNHFSFPYIFGVDAICGLLLCLLLSTSVLPWQVSYLPFALLGIVVIVVISPLMINVSAIYTGSTLVMASILVFHRMQANSGKQTGMASYALTLGLLHAALVAVKSSFALYSVLQLCLFVLLGVAPGTRFREYLKFSLQTGSAALLFLSPWFLLHLPHYIHKSPRDVVAISENGLPEPYIQHIGLFSFTPSYYGPGYAHYTVVALVILALSISIFLLQLRGRSASLSLSLTGLASCGLASALSYFVLVALGPSLNGYDVSLRLTAPILIAALPVIGSLLVLYLSHLPECHWKKVCVTVAVVEIMIVAGFSGDAIARFRQGMTSGNVLAFSGLAASEEYLAYNSAVLYGDVAGRMRRIQQLVPAGKPFFSWVTVPFYFDYKRNEIFDAEQAGIGNPWSYLPDVEYFVIEYEGYAVLPMNTHYDDLRFPGRHERFVTRKVLSLMGMLEKLRLNSEELYNDGGIVVFRMNHGES